MAKLLIFPRKTLAARYYVVPSASRPATRRSEIKIHATRLFSAFFSPTGPRGGGKRPAVRGHHGYILRGYRHAGWEEGTTRNRGGGEGDLTEFANQISSLVYEILGRKEKGAGTLLAFVPIIVPKPTFYPPRVRVWPRSPLNQPFPRQNCYLLETIVAAKKFREIKISSSPPRNESDPFDRLFVATDN